MIWRAILVLGLGLSVWMPELHAQAPAKSEPLSIPALQKRLKSVQEDGELAPAVKEKAVEYLQAAIGRLEVSQEQFEKATKFQRRLQKVDEALQSAEGRLAALPAVPNPNLTKVADLEELSSLVEVREKQLDDAETGLRKQIVDAEAEAELWRIRPEELMNELSELDDRFQAINEEFDQLVSSSEPRELKQAHYLFLQARQQRALNEQKALEAESAWYQSSAASDLAESQRELASKTLALKVAELELLENELGKRRGDAADQRVHFAESIVAHSGASLKSIAEENLALAVEQRELANKLRDIEHRHETTTTALVELQKEFEHTQKMVAEVGLTDSIGLLLRQQRAKLVDPRTIKSNLARRNDLVRETRMRQFQLDADRVGLLDLDAAVAKRMDELESLKDRKSTAASLKTMLADQRQLSKGLDSDYEKFFKQLIAMDNLERRSLKLTTEYVDYVDERVLWIRTGQSFGREQLAKATPTLIWISHSKTWQPVIDAAWHDTVRHPISWGFAVLLFMVWLGLRPVMKRLIQQRGLIAATISCRELLPSLQTLALTFAVACGWPSMIWFLGWKMDHSATAVPFVHAVAAGLLRAATFAFPLELLRVTCLRGGLAERHFDWPHPLINGWRRNLNWFLPLGLLSIGAVGIVEGIADEHRLDTVGRLCFLVFAALSAVFCQLTIRRSKIRSTTSEGVVANDVDVWSERFWRFTPSLAVAACVGLFALGWSGYFYTALQLTWRMQSTAWLAVGLLMVRATIRRWIALERRRMAILQDQELQSIAESGREPENSSHNPFLFPRWNWPDFRLNLTQIVTQMRQLLDTGLITVGVIGMWFVWADVTPALNILDRVTLWQTTVEATETKENANHEPVVQTVRRLKRVTAEDLGLASLIVAICVIAGRNIPGLVEVILLEHLSVDAGTRFAVTWLVRYAIVIGGVCFAFAQIGIGWGNVQWLVAAASVGLGFGLQEIFCNFISGIILLFERPMRVGDTITIGDTTGTVSRIRFRATTIVDGDRKELIVPNKEFITGKLLNWTLSDRVNRVGVKIAVSSHNDPQRVRRLLLDIASQQPLLLKDPAPSAILEELNGGLIFMVRGFLPTLDARSTATHDLYTAIHNRFQAEGIEMSCPSQEVFVRMQTHEAQAETPVPHQPPSAMVKPVSPDFTAALRRA